ncbi:MAG: hypothetical protein RL514_3639 [Verrucomicrobiota bacterium]
MREELAPLLRVCSLPLVACLVFFFVTPANVQPFQLSTAAVRRQVVGVVESQFNAFRDGDYARAYAFAASGIQQQFTVAAFERMVKDGFPVIAYWRAVSFGEVEDNGRAAGVAVSVQGRGGRTRRFRYLLLREGNEWRISGVVEINPSPAGPGQAA